MKPERIEDTLVRLTAERDAARAEVEAAHDALRYIIGEDVPGYEAHMTPEEVAKRILLEADHEERRHKESGDA